MDYVKVREICLRLEIGEDAVREWAHEGLVTLCEPPEAEEAVLSTADAERVRLIALLMREMEVNLAGVEVILHMREDQLAMRRQFDEVLRGLVGELRKRIRE